MRTNKWNTLCTHGQRIARYVSAEGEFVRLATSTRVNARGYKAINCASRHRGSGVLLRCAIGVRYEWRVKEEIR